MSKSVKKNKRERKPIDIKRGLTYVAIISFVLAFFLAVGGYKLIGQTYSSVKVSSIHKKQFSTLAEPLGQFGYNKISRPKSNCVQTQIYGHEGNKLMCTTNENQFKEIGTDKNQQTAFISSAELLDQKLQENDWKTESSSAKSLKEWVQAVAAGEDFKTDINAIKTVNGTTCMLIMTVAYSNPKPPAVNTNLNCTTPVYKQSAAGVVLPQ